jgi:uncharacterized protein (TIGR03067 family)
MIAAVTALSARRIHEWDDVWLRGHWKVTYCEEDGRLFNPYGAEVIYDGTTVKLARGNHDYQLAHNALCFPRSLSLSTVIHGKTDSMRGIYKFKDGKLYVCFCLDENDDVTDFETWPGSARELYILERK